MTSPLAPIHIPPPSEPPASTSSPPAMPQTPKSQSSSSYRDVLADYPFPREMDGDAVKEEHTGESEKEHAHDAKEDKLAEVDEAPAMTMLGLDVAPPTVLPPSPPLTRVESRDSLSIRPRPLDDDEEDFDSHHDGGGIDFADMRDVLGEGGSVTDGLDGDDFGGRRSLRTVPVRAQDHPLRIEANPPSPPPWELIDPPATNDPVGSIAYGTTRSNLSRRQGSSESKAPSRSLIPKSSYYFGPPPVTSAYGTAPVGHIGVHHPREVLRIERDYSEGELIQFSLAYPLELEGRITPTQFLESMNAINELLISTHSLQHAFIDNFLAVFTLQLSRLFFISHYEKEMQRLHELIDDLNIRLFNPAGLNLLWPRKVAFLFLEIEYY